MVAGRIAHVVTQSDRGKTNMNRCAVNPILAKWRRRFFPIKPNSHQRTVRQIARSSVKSLQPGQFLIKINETWCTEGLNIAEFDPTWIGKDKKVYKCL